MDKYKKKDIGYAIAKAGLGSIPIVGAAASELLQLIVTPPLEKRRSEWMEQIGQKSNPPLRGEFFTPSTNGKGRKYYDLR